MSKIISRINGKVKEFLLFVVLAVVLICTAWSIFHAEEGEEIASYDAMTENEVKVARILQEIDGVGEASVIVCESEERIKSVVVVCEGAKNLRVVMDVREAVAAALGTEEKAIKIYLKKG